MTSVRIVAAHDVVSTAYPREVTERDELGMAVGKAIDGALSRYTSDYRRNLKPTSAFINEFAASILTEELSDADLAPSQEERQALLLGISGVIRAFRKSELFGLARPRSRLVLVNGSVGIYAQPDFWDGTGTIYEMKSYRAVPPRPEIVLQLQLFQLAFPRFKAHLVCFNRHTTPTQVDRFEAPPLSGDKASEILRLAYRTGLERGAEKVLEYLDSHIEGYTIVP